VAASGGRRKGAPHVPGFATGRIEADVDGTLRSEHLFAPEPGRWEAVGAALGLPGGGLVLVGTSVEPTARAADLVVRRLPGPPEDGAEPGTDALLSEPCFSRR
jgi:hypothetical protein